MNDGMGTPAGDENRNSFSHLREEVGGDPEQRELLLAVGEPLLASTTASPFLTFSLISLPHFEYILTRSLFLAILTIFHHFSPFFTIFHHLGQILDHYGPF